MANSNRDSRPWQCYLLSGFVALAALLANFTSPTHAQPVVGEETPPGEQTEADALAREAEENARSLAAGRQIFTQCRACHDTKTEPDRAIGPSLAGIYKRRIGSLGNFDYSRALSSARKRRMKWSDKNLDKFLRAPNDFLAGNKMAFRGVTGTNNRKDLIAYLKSL